MQKITYLYLFIIFTCLFSSLSLSGEKKDIDREIAEMAKKIEINAHQQKYPNWLNNSHTEQANRLVSGMNLQSNPKKPDPILNSELSSEDVIEIYVSLSLGNSALEELFLKASGKDNIFIIFRGIDKNEDGKKFKKIPAFLKKIRSLAKDINPLPNVIIDPNRFKKGNVEVVPSMILKNGKEILSKVTGTLAFDWFYEKYKSEKSNNFGQYGEVFEISEVDLIEEIKRRINAIDWEDKKEKAFANYWKKQEFINLGKAKENKTRILDPTVVATDDIKDEKGDIVVKNGSRVNPLDKMAFTSILIVFDATDKKEVKKAKEIGEKYYGKRNVIYITNKVNREKGWGMFSEIEAILGRKLFYLNSAIKDRFKINKTISVIESDGKSFLIKEIGIG